VQDEPREVTTCHPRCGKPIVWGVEEQGSGQTGRAPTGQRVREARCPHESPGRDE
jgi:hypothetical protein